MRENEEVAYEVSNLTKIYPNNTAAINANLSFTVRRGEIFGILGDNGAGKSTLVRQMVGLIRSTSGTVRLFGQPIYPNRERSSLLVGYMPQQSDALNRLTVGEALFFTAHLRGMNRRDAANERDRLIECWALESLRNRDNALLSGGQRRLVRLAVAMAGSPPVLVLDEPTNDLDPLRRRRVWDILQSLNAKQKTTIVFVTHDAVEAEKLIQRVAIMHHGRFIALGHPSELNHELSRDLRVELHFSPDSAPEISGLVRFERRASDHCIFLCEWTEVANLFHSLRPDQIKSIRINSPSLEDLYIHYVETSEPFSPTNRSDTN